MKTSHDLRNEFTVHLIHNGTEAALEHLWFELMNGTCGLRLFQELVRMTLDTYIQERAAEKEPGVLAVGTALGFRVHNSETGLFMANGPWGRKWSKTGRTWLTVAHLKSSLTGKLGRPGASINRYYLREISELKKFQVFDISANKLIGSVHDLWERPAKK